MTYTLPQGLNASGHEGTFIMSVEDGGQVYKVEGNTYSINGDTVSQNLYTCGIPDPDLLIRTSGEYRISNFMLWQLAYAELYFTPTLWPDFDKEELYKAIVDYQQRERRFGMTSEQLGQSI